MDTFEEQFSYSDPIGSVLKQLRDSPKLAGLKISRGQLNTIAEIYEEHGPGGAEVYILDKASSSNVRDGLLEALRIIHDSSAVARNRVVGRYIIKTLTSILQTGGEIHESDYKGRHHTSAKQRY